VTRAGGCNAGAPSTRAAFEFVAQLGDLAPGLLVLTGGNLLERADLGAIVGEAARQNLRVSIAPGITAGVTPVAIRRLADAGVVRAALHLDGPDAVTHDRVRGTPGAFAVVRAAIAAVREAGLPLQIDTSLTARTVEAIPRTAELIAGIGPLLWNVCFVVPVGRTRLDPQLGPDACERVFNFLAAWSERTGVAVDTTAAPAYRRVAQRLRWPRAPRPLPVNDGKGLVFVSHTGDVYPSALLLLTTGNVGEVPVAELYRKSRLFRALRDTWRLEGKCGLCPFHALCGGSRARAYATTGNFLAADPACAWQPPTPSATWLSPGRATPPASTHPPPAHPCPG
jgi:radical SAM protein with 4Fe4S-binding SPASM domain